MNIHPDTLHRTLKLELDDGTASSFDEAAKITAGYILQIDVGEEIADSAVMQAMLLTAVNTAVRAFPGGVRVRGAANPVLSTRWAGNRTLNEVVHGYGGTTTARLSSAYPTLVIGTSQEPAGQPVLYLTWNGWAGAAVVDPTARLAERGDLPLVGILAAALGVSELFQYVRGSARTGYRNVGLSLWRPDADWRDPAAAGPVCRFLPQRLMIAGLGHLGQAVCWALGFLPYPDPNQVEFALQDFDIVISANVSTGLLTSPADLRRRKTRVVAASLERLGFTTRIIEKRIDEHARRTVDEPTWAVAGFDKVEPRRHLLNAGFAKVVDIGVGAGVRDYLDILIHAFPSGMTATEAWPDNAGQPRTPALATAYEAAVQHQIRAGVSEGSARCGIIELAGISVAASFVGATAACLAGAELLRSLHGGTENDVPIHEVVSLCMANPAHVDVAPNRHREPVDHPGFVLAAPAATT